jgi:hypothetical protein
MTSFVVCKVCARTTGSIILALRSSKAWSTDDIWYIENALICLRKLNRILIIQNSKLAEFSVNLHVSCTDLAETLSTSVIEASITSEKHNKFGSSGEDFLVSWREASKVRLRSLEAA